MIQNKIIPADENPEYSTDPGNVTTDKVFLLSINEVSKYFRSNEARRCAPTAYAKARGAWTSSHHQTYPDGETACWWWLRSPGSYQTAAAYVFSDGSVNCTGDGVNDDTGCIRPAMWIGFDSIR